MPPKRTDGGNSFWLWLMAGLLLFTMGVMTSATRTLRDEHARTVATVTATTPEGDRR